MRDEIAGRYRYWAHLLMKQVATGTCCPKFVQGITKKECFDQFFSLEFSYVLAFAKNGKEKQNGVSHQKFEDNVTS